MTIKTLLRKGFDHRIFCEDYLYSFENDNWIIAATFDGCSDGIDSHFASSLAGKCLKMILGKPDAVIEPSSIYNFDSCFHLYETIIKNFLIKFEEMRTILQLSGKEMLTTVILMVYNKKTDQGHIIAMGDGIVSINGELHVIDQNNEPEYPIVYAGAVTKDANSFNKFIGTHKNQWFFTGLEDIVLSTDGLLQLKNKKNPELKADVAADFFINNNEMKDLDVMLGRKYNILKLQGWENHDDLGIIRIMNNKNEKEKEIKQEAENHSTVH